MELENSIYETKSPLTRVFCFAQKKIAILFSVGKISWDFQSHEMQHARGKIFNATIDDITSIPSLSRYFLFSCISSCSSMPILRHKQREAVA